MTIRPRLSRITGRAGRSLSRELKSIEMGQMNKLHTENMPIGIVGFHLIEQKRAFSLGFLSFISADSATPAVISEIEPSGGCSV